MMWQHIAYLFHALFIEQDASAAQALHDARDRIVQLGTAASTPPAAFARFTNHARSVMKLANREACALSHDRIDSVHLLAALFDLENGLSAEAVARFGIDAERVRREIAALFPTRLKWICEVRLPQTTAAKLAIEHAIDEARELGHRYIDAQHLFVALLHESEGIVSQILGRFNLTIDAARAAAVDAQPPRT